MLKTSCSQSLEGLTNLRTLELGGNRVTEIAGLDSLGRLEELWLGRNRITSITNLNWYTPPPPTPAPPISWVNCGNSKLPALTAWCACNYKAIPGTCCSANVSTAFGCDAFFLAWLGVPTHPPTLMICIMNSMLAQGKIVHSGHSRPCKALPHNVVNYPSCILRYPSNKTAWQMIILLNCPCSIKWVLDCDFKIKA